MADRITRRGFVGRILALTGGLLSGKVAGAEAIVSPRPCYVHLGQHVSYIGLAKYPAPTFIGSSFVEEIEPWDGVGYPCRVRAQSWDSNPDGSPRLMPKAFYDHDLATLHEIPRDVYVREIGPGKRYPTLRHYIRSQRATTKGEG